MSGEKKDDTNSPQNTDIFNSRYFYVNKTLNIKVGLWPYHPSRNYVRILWIIMLVLFTTPHIIGLRVNYANIDKMLYNVSYITFMAAVFFKYITVIIAENKLRVIYDGIVNNWSMIIDSEEQDILKTYSETGRKLTLAYIGLMVGIYIIYVTLPLIPIILNVINPLPEPRPLQYILYGEFLLDNPDDHYVKIYIWDLFSAAAIVIVLLAIDPLYAACIHHCLGLYTILKYRLQKPNQLVFCETMKSKDASYDYVVNIVKTHQNILEFTQTLEAAYSFGFLVIMCVHIIAVPIISVIMIANLDNNTIDFVRYVMLFISLKIHLFGLCYPAQRLMDYSKGLFSDAYCNEWYASSEKTMKLLNIFMLRCTEPCTITAGGLANMDMENFLSITKTSVSYVTVLAAFRGS